MSRRPSRADQMMPPKPATMVAITPTRLSSTAHVTWDVPSLALAAACRVHPAHRGHREASHERKGDNDCAATHRPSREQAGDKRQVWLPVTPREHQVDEYRLRRAAPPSLYRRRRQLASARKAVRARSTPPGTPRAVLIARAMPDTRIERRTISNSRVGRNETQRFQEPRVRSPIGPPFVVRHSSAKTWPMRLVLTAQRSHTAQERRRGCNSANSEPANARVLHRNHQVIAFAEQRMKSVLGTGGV